MENMATVFHHRLEEWIVSVTEKVWNHRSPRSCHRSRDVRNESRLAWFDACRPWWRTASMVSSRGASNVAPHSVRWVGMPHIHTYIH